MNFIDQENLGLTDEGEDGEEEKKARAATEEIVDRRVKEGGGGDGGGEEDLSGEDAVDLTDEAPTEDVVSVAETRVESGPFSSFQIYLDTTAIFAIFRFAFHALVSEHLLRLVSDIFDFGFLRFNLTREIWYLNIRKGG